MTILRIECEPFASCASIGITVAKARSHRSVVGIHFAVSNHGYLFGRKSAFRDGFIFLMNKIIVSTGFTSAATSRIHFPSAQFQISLLGILQYVSRLIVVKGAVEKKEIMNCFFWHASPS